MKGLGYLAASIVLFFLSLAAVDYWVFNIRTGPESTFNYWIAIGFAFVSFGASLAIAMWISNPKINPKILLGIFITPFMLLVAGIWDWIIYFLFLRYETAYPDFKYWSAQYRWFGFWNFELQLIWTFAFIIIVIVMWMKILGKKIRVL